jgi:hypothetical protein
VSNWKWLLALLVGFAIVKIVSDVALVLFLEWRRVE